MLTYRELVDKAIDVEAKLFEEKIVEKPIHGRFKHYKDLITKLRDNWESNTMDKFEKHYSTGDVGFALKELNELVDILEQILTTYKSLSFESQRTIKEKITLILSGPNFTIDENQKNSQARNYQFELRLVAKIIEAKYSYISFQEHPDFSVIVNKRNYAFECKRILGVTNRTLFTNVESAIKQLKNYSKDYYGGIVAIDISTRFEQGEKWLNSPNREEANRFTLDELGKYLSYIYNNSYKLQEIAIKGNVVAIVLNLSTAYVLKENNEMGWIQESAFLMFNKENPVRALQFEKDFEELKKYLIQ